MLQIAVEVQKQAASGRLGSQSESVPPVNEVDDDGDLNSEYENSDKEIDTLPESDDDKGVEVRRQSGKKKTHYVAVRFF